MPFIPTPQALEILKKRYFLPGEDWEGMCHRVAHFLANDEEQEKKFYDVLVNGLLLPNTPCLINS